MYWSRSGRRRRLPPLRAHCYERRRCYATVYFAATDKISQETSQPQLSDACSWVELFLFTVNNTCASDSGL